MRNSKVLALNKIPSYMVAWLSAEGWTAEELSFIETYGIFNETDYNNETRLKVQNYMKIRARQEAQKGEREREYDSKNILKGKDSPSWFREGTDRNLFK